MLNIFVLLFPLNKVVREASLRKWHLSTCKDPEMEVKLAKGQENGQWG